MQHANKTTASGQDRSGEEIGAENDAVMRKDR